MSDLQKQKLEELSEQYEQEHSPIQPISKIDGDIILEIIEHLRLNDIGEDILSILYSYKMNDDSEILNELIELNKERLTYQTKERYFISIQNRMIDIRYINSISTEKIFNSVSQPKYMIILNPSTEPNKTNPITNIKLTYFDEGQYKKALNELLTQLEKFNVKIINKEIIF